MLLPNGVAKAPVARSSSPPAHPGKRWTRADALRAFAIREQMRWRGNPQRRPEIGKRRSGHGRFDEALPDAAGHERAASSARRSRCLIEAAWGA